MPWTPETFRKRHNHHLTKAQSKVAAKVANQVLRRTGDEARAIMSGNAAGDKAHHFGKK